MKEIAIFSRGLSMNGANKSLIELLKRLDYSILKLDLYILDFDNSSTDLIKSIPFSIYCFTKPYKWISKFCLFPLKIRPSKLTSKGFFYLWSYWPYLLILKKIS